MKQLYVVIVTKGDFVIKVVGPFDQDKAVDYSDRLYKQPLSGYGWEIHELTEAV